MKKDLNCFGKYGIMKKERKKHLSIERRDLWDGSTIYEFWHLSVDKLKHKLRHVSKKDRKIKSALERALNWKLKK